MVQPLWKTVWRSLKKLKIELPYDPAIALLGIYPKDTDIVKRRALCTPMFIAVLSTMAKSWKEPRFPSTDEWIKKMEYYSAIRRNDYPEFPATWMGLEEIMLSEMSSRERQLSYGFTHLWDIRNNEIGRRKGKMKGG